MKASNPHDSPWWKNCIFYSAYVDKFAGNFSGLTKKLEYLKRLGIDCIHLLPFYPSPMIDDGYDVSDYCGVRENLGTLEDFSRFMGAAHERGLRVMIDLVLNHASTKHPWFIEAKSSLHNARRDFFLWSKSGAEYAGASNPFSELKPSNWIYNPQTDDYYFSTYYPEQADLNWNNPQVFSQMMHIVDFWIRSGVDGFRLDAAARLVKRDGTSCIGLPETHALLKKIRAHLDMHHPGVILLGEAPGRDFTAALKTYFGAGDECHLVYFFPLVGKLFLALKRNDAGIIRTTVEESGGIPPNTQWVTLLRHHDELPLATIPETDRQELLDYFDPDKKYRFNLGISLRLATMFRGDKEKILDAFRLLFKVPGSPIIYYGDEIGMKNETLPRGVKDTRKSVRGIFDWKKAEVQMSDPGSLLNGVIRIVQARKQDLRETA
jgi:maltose alpha-D-glucosyltransferase/alpha-amylase